MKITIGSLLIGSSQADEMKRFYRHAFGWEENEMGAFVVGGLQIFFESHSEISGSTKEAARVIINLNVTGCREIEAHLKNLDVRWIRPVEQMPFGLIGTIADPDGNYIQIIEWGATPTTHRD